MPQLFDWKLNVCYSCGKPLSMCRRLSDGNLQIIEISKEDFNYDEIYDIYLCNECYVPEQIDKVASL